MIKWKNHEKNVSIQPAQVINSTRTGFFWIFRGPYFPNGSRNRHEIFNKHTSQYFQQTHGV